MSKKGYTAAKELISKIIIEQADQLKNQVYQRINEMPLKLRFIFAFKVILRRL
jgi:hypothetical protein